jgi:hypothetical protein
MSTTFDSTLKLTTTAGMYAVSGGIGFGLGESVAGSWLSNQIPSVFRSLLPQRLRDPNHDLTRAFHAALRDTLIHATGKQNPILVFQKQHAAEWHSLLFPQKDAIAQWMTDLTKAATDHERAGRHPVIGVGDAFLKTLAEDRTGDALQTVQREVRDALRQRFAAIPGHKDEDIDRATALFIDWFSRQIGTQLSVHFWQQLKTDEKARTAYFGLVAEAIQGLLTEVAEHTVGIRQEQAEQAVALQQLFLLVKNLERDQQAATAHLESLIRSGQQRLDEQFTVIQTQLSQIGQGMQQLLDGSQPQLHQTDVKAAIVRGSVAIRDLDYRQRLIPFQPRPADMDRLDDFLHSSHRFTWWAVIGEGGMGKSRLAQELIQRCLDAGWQAGFLNRTTGQDWLKKQHRFWQPAFPTLIVLDYASERTTELLSFLAELHARAAGLRQPVRVLLLDRPGAVGPLFSDLLEKQRQDGHCREAALQALWQPHPDQPAPDTFTEESFLRILPAYRDQWPTYFDAVLAALNQPTKEWPAPDAEFWQHIDRLTHHGRPLYLQMAAIALHYERHDDGDLHLTTANATDLLDAILRYELTERWPLILEAHQAQHLEPALRRAVGFVTLTRGLDPEKDRERAALFAAAEVEEADQSLFKEALCALLPLEPGTSALPPLQPDLLGERYLLLGGATPATKAKKNAFGQAKPQAIFVPASFVPLAHQCRRGHLPEVFSLLLQDFPKDEALPSLLERALGETLAFVSGLPDGLLATEPLRQMFAQMVSIDLSWYPNLVHLARQQRPLPATLIAPLAEAIRSQSHPEVQRALLFPLVLLREECGADTRLLQWTTDHLLPSQETVHPTLQSAGALLCAQGAFNAISHYGSGGPEHFPAMERWLGVLQSVAQAHAAHPEIQLELAKGAFNASNNYGSGGPEHFPAMERCLGVLQSVAAAHPEHPEIQLRLAKGAFNASANYLQHQPQSLPKWIAVLAEAAAFPPEVEQKVPMLARLIFQRSSDFPPDTEGAMPPEGIALYISLAVLGQRWPDLPLGRDAEGNVLTAGRFTAIFTQSPQAEDPTPFPDPENRNETKDNDNPP